MSEKRARDFRSALRHLAANGIELSRLPELPAKKVRRAQRLIAKKRELRR